MKLVVLTNKGSFFGGKIVHALIDNKIEIEAVVVIKQSLGYYRKLFKSVQKRVGVWEAIYFTLKRILGFLKRKRLCSCDEDERRISIFYTKGTNSRETLDILKILSPDLLILGQTGIVKKELLEIPAIGTLNAHPGILPYYRGIDCAKWAIFNAEFEKIGITVHWVNSGIDRGNIITKEFYRFSGNETLEKLNEYLYDLCVSTLTRVILLIHGGTIPGGDTQSPTEGSQYYKMPIEFERLMRKKLEDFLRQIRTSMKLQPLFNTEPLDKTVK